MKGSQPVPLSRLAAYERQEGSTTGYVIAATGVALATLVRWAIDPLVQETSRWIIYLPVILISGLIGGVRPALLAMVSGGILGWLLFVEPHWSIGWSGRRDDLFALLLYVLTALITVALTHSQRRAVQSAFASHEMVRKESAARHNIEQKLSESREEFRELVAGVKDYAIFMLDPDGQIITWNAGAQRIKGYADHEILGKHYSILFTPQAREAGIPQRNLELALAVGRHEDEGIRMRKDGSTFWADAVITPIFDSTGEVRGFIKITRDITQRKHQEEELRLHRSHLERLVHDRTLDMEAFTYSVSHDLRAPLRSMQGFANALIESSDPAQSRESRDYALRIKSAAERMDRLISDLLDYSSLNRTEMALKPVDLNAVLQDVLTALQSSISEAKAQITVKAPLHHVLGHRPILAQVIDNLISNAIKFAAQGQAPEISICSAARDGWIRLQIQDRGIGIPAQQQEQVFIPFERLHGIERYPGTGIGLAIVKRGVERMGGTVGVQSEPGKGSTFWIQLRQAEP